MKVRDTMSGDAKSCQPSDSMETAARIMWENDCGCVPVVEHDGRIVGVLTDRDICMAAYTQGKPIAEMSVASGMATNVVTVSPEDAIATAQHLMEQHQIRRLPVAAGDRKLVGILSLADIALAPENGSRKDKSSPRVEQTLAAIIAPRA